MTRCCNRWQRHYGRQAPRNGVRDIVFSCLVAAPEGVAALQSAHPDIPIITAALDRELNDKAYIMPGLGDAGDRIYGTD